MLCGPTHVMRCHPYQRFLYFYLRWLNYKLL
ncbi:MAG: hypothetical protein E7248_12575 [Paenibacillaceae bacterium]|nr:hypothetical protein [Paenibacillaceae bacterium]